MVRRCPWMDNARLLRAMFGRRVLPSMWRNRFRKASRASTVQCPLMMRPLTRSTITTAQRCWKWGGVQCPVHVEFKLWRPPEAKSIILTASQGNVAIIRFWGGQIIKHALQINLGFCSNVSPSNKESDPNENPQMLGISVKLT